MKIALPDLDAAKELAEKAAESAQNALPFVARYQEELDAEAKKVHPDRLPEVRDKLRAEHVAKFDAHARKAVARLEELQAMAGRVDAPTLRLQAALSDVTASAALRDRLESCSIAQLQTLAQDAATRKDWALADAVVTVAGTIASRAYPDAKDHAKRDAMTKEVIATADAMIDPGLRPALTAAIAPAAEALRRLVRARRELMGLPLSRYESSTLAFQIPTARDIFGPESTAASAA